MKKEIITIDGPSGSGKSTISRIVAARLGFTYLDTGAMYRTMGYYALREGVDLDDEKGLGRLLENLDLELYPGDHDTRIFLNKQEISELIRTAEMGMAASRVSALPVVREKLTAIQQEIGRSGKVVAEGRDTGTIVFPEAAHKFYLDASSEERARRRTLQLREQGYEADESEILKQIKERDEADSSRSQAPLRAAEDAVVIDSSKLTIEEVIRRIIAKVKGDASDEM
ncbi:MAG: (d)CMP kinase [Desulfurivibrionaceae bacterium]